MARINSRQTHSDKHCGQSDTKSRDQKQPKACAMQSDSTQQDHQRSWTRYDSSGDTQHQQLPRGNFSGLLLCSLRCSFPSSGEFVAMSVRKIPAEIALQKKIATHPRDECTG